MQAVWGTDTPEIDETVAPKRQRLFIARQACEICRQKKTRCDGGHPCGLCRTGGLECKYAERKATKNEVSLGMIFNTLQRIEAKIEEGQQRSSSTEADDDERARQGDGEDGDEETNTTHEQQRRLKRGRKRSSVGQAPRPHVQTSVVQPPTPAAHVALPSPSTQPPAVNLASPSAGSTQSRDGIHALLSAASPSSYPYPQPPPPRRPRHVPVIQYPIRQLANWPAIRDLLHKSGITSDSNRSRRRSSHNNGFWTSDSHDSHDSVYVYDAAAATVLEQRRPPLPFPPLLLSSHSHNSSGSGDNWLAQLNVAVVKDLGDKYFTTFNLGNPVLDRRLFHQHSLGVAIGTGFGVNMESCIVLVTMALGVLGRKAQRDAGIVDAHGMANAMATSPYDPPHRSSSTTAADGPDDGDAWDDGLVFFNEARKRIGMLGCDSSLQACQYHLLCGLFYAQRIRPLDWWAHVSRAAACCTSFWACAPKDCDEWTMDMQARLFWITAMFEAVLTQELDVPVSNLLNYEDRVPLPKFVEFPGVSSFASFGSSMGMGIGMGPHGLGGASNGQHASQEEEQDAFCHYHFLSQIAHRIILTRLCDSLFANRGKALASGQTIEAASQATTMARSDYPPQALEDELTHQLEQWRAQLPNYLQWDDDNKHRYADPAAPFEGPRTPANIFVVPWLQARYCIARYHLRRPLLHRALHHPDWMSAADFDKCRDALACAVRWCSIIQPTLNVPDCLYLKFFICTQLFGMLLLLHTLDRSAVPALRALVPPTFASWRLFAFGVLERYAPMSPSVARELEIVSALRDDQPPPAAVPIATSVLRDSHTEDAGDPLATGLNMDADTLSPPHAKVGETASAYGLVDETDYRRNTRSSRRGSLHEL
ncbi:hypothetical protein HMPREF1624_01655 [Sporothrix schenckii ATCC 58251]|uniref:Zn(2)-C6 fungal-type domain-containing protein n=1 Tax=Sporothrix schenckii (strain ATCC 58251 / de Perez 2211183) TaxID=1391915 RepID=U7Q680_SPOS1|nr:hypothetical protein HMPREF1624_01655 [Sporothrix schenckii ATCC 58251]